MPQILQRVYCFYGVETGTAPRAWLEGLWAGYTSRNSNTHIKTSVYLSQYLRRLVLLAYSSNLAAKRS